MARLQLGYAKNAHCGHGYSYHILSSFEGVGKVTDLRLVINMSFVNKKGKLRIMKYKKEERRCIGALMGGAVRNSLSDVDGKPISVSCWASE